MHFLLQFAHFQILLRLRKRMLHILRFLESHLFFHLNILYCLKELCFCLPQFHLHVGVQRWFSHSHLLQVVWLFLFFIPIWKQSWNWIIHKCKIWIFNRIFKVFVFRVKILSHICIRNRKVFFIIFTVNPILCGRFFQVIYHQEKWTIWSGCKPWCKFWK